MTDARKFRATLLDAFRIEGRGTLLVFADDWSGDIRGGDKIRVGGVEMMVRGFHLHRPRYSVGRSRPSMLVGEGHHAHLVASIGEEVEGM